MFQAIERLVGEAVPVDVESSECLYVQHGQRAVPQGLQEVGGELVHARRFRLAGS